MEPQFIHIIKSMEKIKKSKKAFGDYNPNQNVIYHDMSFRLPKGIKGRIAAVKEVPKGPRSSLRAEKVYRIWVVKTSRVRIGDKLSGRHGNKGVVTTIVRREDMPYLPDGSVLDVLLNPLGVPSRMNLGQLFESILGFAALNLQVVFRLPQFSSETREENFTEMTEKLLNTVKANKRWVNPKDNKYVLRDGRTGMAYSEPVFIGVAYLHKLVHVVEKKIHARSVGPYSSITQQPSAGKAQGGGQRIGEMEVWALEAHGAAYTLREMLTVKSDDLLSREEAYRCMVQNSIIPGIGMADSFRVLLSELRSLCMNVDSFEVAKGERKADGRKVLEVKKVDPFDEEDIHLLEKRLAGTNYAHPDSVINKRGPRKKKATRASTRKV
jgi:DNA-directed RNA polymerase subunit beta